MPVGVGRLAAPAGQVMDGSALVTPVGATFIFSTVCSQPSEVGLLKAGETESRAEERADGLGSRLPTAA